MDPQSTASRQPRKRCRCGCFLPDAGDPTYVCGGCAAIAAGRRRLSQNKAEANGMWKGDAAHPARKRERARRLFALEGLCQVCGERPAIDRHHRDGDPGNNVPENILLCCRRCHMKLDGRLDTFARRPPRRGYDNPLVKLTAAQEEEIRTLYASGRWTQTQLGARYGVAHATISRVCRREGFRGFQAPSSS